MKEMVGGKAADFPPRSEIVARSIAWCAILTSSDTIANGSRSFIGNESVAFDLL